MVFHRARSRSAIFFILLLVVVHAGSLGAKEASSWEQWKNWVGKKVNVTYDCCGNNTCTQIKDGELKDVTDKLITIVTKGKEYLIPNYIIKAVELSE